MMGKNPVTKVASVLASVMLFVLLWGAIAAVGWGGAGSVETADPAAVAVPEAAAPAPSPPPVTIKRTVVVRRIHQADGSTDASAAPPPAAAPAPVAPPPQPAPPPAPAPEPKPNATPVTKTKGS